MRTIRFVLLTGTLALVNVNADAASVLFTFQSQFPGTDWHIAWRDGAANLITLDASDTDGNGMTSAIGDLDLTTTDTAIYMKEAKMLRVLSALEASVIALPLFQAVTGDSLVTQFEGRSAATFILGQSVTVVNGQIMDFNGSVHVDPGITSATALLNSDVLAFPIYNGQARVVALFSAAVVPEPATLVLLITGISTICCRRHP